MDISALNGTNRQAEDKPAQGTEQQGERKDNSESPGTERQAED
jgi:hypothetical protein